MSAKTIRFYPWVTMAFRWDVLMMNFHGRRDGRTNLDNASMFMSTHSELNAILNYRGGSLEGCKVICYHFFHAMNVRKRLFKAGIKDSDLWYRQIFRYTICDCIKAYDGCSRRPLQTVLGKWTKDYFGCLKMNYPVLFVYIIK